MTNQHHMLDCLSHEKTTPQHTLGIDLGDRKHAICITDQEGYPIGYHILVYESLIASVTVSARLSLTSTIHPIGCPLTLA